ncbi:MAG TPA: adenylyltransferase/cytidyltransferase family protein [Thermoanaerobaculia bacterium]|nr:adenylyltransferase/cytidyltransferase family protein [Thermoanaerobaculia bacterium]
MNAPILERKALIAAIESERARGKTIALANGCFDLLHVGHVRFLQAAAAAADVLVVAINGDASARRLKGEGRPLVPQDERAELVAAIRGVDYVTLFHEPSPAPLLAELRPDLQCKGTDYTADTVPEAELVRSWGGKVVIVGDPKDHSTSDLIARLGHET